MSSAQSFKKNKFFRLCLIVLCGLVASWLPVQTPVVHAQDQEYGYLWNLYFDFNSSFNGVLTLEVGPWENGNLTSVDETSTTRVRCEPVGDVLLDSGAAVFINDGYLECSFNIGEAVNNNHNLTPNDPDTYGSFVMRTRAALSGVGIAPIFHHPDAQYRLNAVDEMATEITSDLSNENGPMSALFTPLDWNTWQTYTSQYVCVIGIACDLNYFAGGSNTTLLNQGKPVTFTTEETTFYIGRDETNFFNGRIDALLIDPGNSAH